MPLTPEQRRLYARHLLLSDLGEQGQAALCNSRVNPASDADGRVRDVAMDYLQRAGVEQSPEGTPLALARPQVVRQLAGREELEHAAAALLGAFAAVEAIKQHSGAGEPGVFPDSLTLAVEES